MPIWDWILPPGELCVCGRLLACIAHAALEAHCGSADFIFQVSITTQWVQHEGGALCYVMLACHVICIRFMSAQLALCAQVAITSQQLVTASQGPTITINFGGRVTQLNPLLLYNLTGADRTDVVYDVNNGVVYITAYVDPDQAADI